MKFSIALISGLLVASCSSPVCHCPSGVINLAVPVGQSTQLQSIKGDVCTASLNDSPSGMAQLGTSNGKDCIVEARFADGSVETAVVKFVHTAGEGGCCAGYALAGVTWSGVADGGTD